MQLKKYNFVNMSIFLGAVKKKVEDIYYIVQFAHKRRDDSECEIVENAKDEKDAIKKAFKIHRERHPNTALTFLSVWDSKKRFVKFADGTIIYKKYNGC